MENDNRSWWSVVRYIPDVERQEFRNIGVFLLRQEPHFTKASFLLPIEFPNPRYQLLRTAMGHFGFELPKELLSQFSAESAKVDLDLMKRYCEEATNMYQFKEPLPWPTDKPDDALEELYRIYLAPIPNI